MVAFGAPKPGWSLSSRVGSTTWAGSIWLVGFHSDVSLGALRLGHLLPRMATVSVVRIRMEMASRKLVRVASPPTMEGLTTKAA